MPTALCLAGRLLPFEGSEHFSVSAILWTFLKLLLLLTCGYFYNLMTQLYFRHEIAIGFKNVMLRIKIILNIAFPCKVTIHEF